MVRNVWIGNVSKGTVDAGGAYTLALSDLPDYSEIAASWDLWRIDEIQFQFILAAVDQGSTWGPATTTVVTCPDYNDASAPASENELLVKENTIIKPLGVGKYEAFHTIKPRVNVATYQGVTTGYSLGPEGAWIPTANSGVRYYGLKYWLSNYSTTYTSKQVVAVRARVKLSVAGTQ